MEKRPLKKLLVVDDDDDLLNIIQYLFENHPDISVKYTSSGEEAIKEAIEFIPDLILLDVIMPDMDGVETLKAIQQVPSIANIPVIFLTAIIQDKDKVPAEYKQMGIIDIIVKPFDVRTFITNILQIWDQYQGN